MFFKTEFLCNSRGYPEISFVDQAGHELNRDHPISASQLLGLKMCSNTAQLFNLYLRCLNGSGIAQAGFECIYS